MLQKYKEAPNFTSFTGNSVAEARLNNYLTKQSRICSHKGYRMVIAGDVRSYIQPNLDHLVGPTNIRPGCFAANLTALGFKDTFKERHG